MHPTQKPAVYRKAAHTTISAAEIDAAKARLLALGDIGHTRLLGQLTAIIFLLSLEPVGQHAFELIREAQADIAAYEALVKERETRWHYRRDDAPEQTPLAPDDVFGYPLGRAVKR